MGKGMTKRELKADKEEAIAAVKNDGDALQHASDELKADKEVVMVAVEAIELMMVWTKFSVRPEHLSLRF